ncbi:H-NS histone family protein [Cupriavidus pauculus]|uniref:H-NS histone family protein n=1 Tax=Cupriavidus pauculus TaxID=82633 RepID=UPI00203AD8CC|nr:H-NS histone family protein [Cupriavidus pauculus]MCM3609176.1 H-NS histone family protein [Cupriavidus pauculus]
MATSKYTDLRAQIAKLEAQAEAARAAEIEEVLADVREKVATYGLTEQQVFGRRRGAGKAATAKGAVAPKYRDPKTGAEWSGRGRAPAWIAGKKRERFLIEE